MIVRARMQCSVIRILTACWMPFICIEFMIESCIELPYVTKPIMDTGMYIHATAETDS